VYERILRGPLAAGKRSVLLLGPRQVGKSTLLASLEPDRELNLARTDQMLAYSTDPARLRRELDAAPARERVILIDEIQRVPALLDDVQSILDEKPKRFRFLLSGSSARKLRRGQVNLLPGRVEAHWMHPLVRKELGAAFELERALAHGMLPGVWNEVEPRERASLLRSYSETYLREEIQAEALVRSLGGYARLLDLVAASSGRILNLNALCNDAGLRYETARRYVEVLEDTLVVYRVPAWSGSAANAVVAHPKLYLFDIGVRNALLRRPLDACLDDERGLLFEHLIAGELRARMGSLWPDMSVHHYRTRGGAEVDFVLSLPREQWGIELKASKRVDARDLSGLRSLGDALPRVKRKLVVFLGDRPQKFDDVEVLPLEQFLELLPS
jgi:predicted AAA+ superfamily ATPase